MSLTYFPSCSGQSYMPRHISFRDLFIIRFIFILSRNPIDRPSFIVSSIVAVCVFGFDFGIIFFFHPRIMIASSSHCWSPAAMKPIPGGALLCLFVVAGSLIFVSDALRKEECAATVRRTVTTGRGRATSSAAMGPPVKRRANETSSTETGRSNDDSARITEEQKVKACRLYKVAYFSINFLQNKIK